MMVGDSFPLPFPLHPFQLTSCTRFDPSKGWSMVNPSLCRIIKNLNLGAWRNGSESKLWHFRRFRERPPWFFSLVHLVNPSWKIRLNYLRCHFNIGFITITFQKLESSNFFSKFQVINVSCRVFTPELQNIKSPFSVFEAKSYQNKVFCSCIVLEVGKSIKNRYFRWIKSFKV